MKKVLLKYMLMIFCMPLMASEEDFFMQFDCPFPASPYKGVLTACMRVRHAAELLAEQHGRENTEIMCDVLAGRLLRLDAQLLGLSQDISALHPEDKEYMASIIACMVSEIAYLIHGKKIHCTLLSHVLAVSIQEKVEKLSVQAQ